MDLYFVVYTNMKVFYILPLLPLVFGKMPGRGISSDHLDRAVSISGYTYVGNGVCRYDGWIHTYTTVHGSKTTEECSQICTEASNCIAFAVYSGVVCYTFKGSGENMYARPHH